MNIAGKIRNKKALAPEKTQFLNIIKRLTELMEVELIEHVPHGKKVGGNVR